MPTPLAHPRAVRSQVTLAAAGRTAANVSGVKCDPRPQRRPSRPRRGCGSSEPRLEALSRA